MTSPNQLRTMLLPLASPGTVYPMQFDPSNPNHAPDVLDCADFWPQTTSTCKSAYNADFEPFAYVLHVR